MRIDPSSFLFSSPLCISFSAATPAFRPRQHATLGTTESPRARCLHNARLSDTHTGSRLSPLQECVSTFPPRTKKLPLFHSFSPHISALLPPLLFGAASRVRVRAHITRAHQSVFIFCLHPFTHLAYFTISQRITCEGFGVFSFTPLVPWLHPESKEFSSRLFAKNWHQSRRNRGEKNGESKGEGKKQKPSPLNSSRPTFCDRSVKR